MAAKHARHDMREDKNFKGTDPSETTAQYLYCGLVTEIEITSWLVSAYDFYSRVVKDR